MDSTIGKTQKIECNPSLPHQGRSARTWAGHCLSVLSRWCQYARTRRQLAQLDDRQLADMNISLADRAAELDKAFWR